MNRVQQRVQEAMDSLVSAGSETGVQVCVVQAGHTVVDVASGTTDADSRTPVTEETLFYAASTAKGVASAVAHVLVERGRVDYDTVVAEVWPEFGAHGKAAVTLRHILMHTAGVPGLPAQMTVEDLCNWDHVCAVLADAQLWWEPGTRMGYHAHTFGFLLGETLRRATGQPLSALLRDEITNPLGVGDEVHFGVPEHLLPRVARQVAGVASPEPAIGSPLARALPRGVRPDADYANRRDVLTSDIPSGGTMTARGVARLYAGLLGHIEGITLVSPDRLGLMAAPAFSGPDEVMGMRTTWAFGFATGRPGGVPSRRGAAFGMVGMNGCAAYADVDSGIAVAVLRNRFSPGDLTAVTRVDEIVADAFP